MRVRYPGPSTAVDIQGPDGDALRVKRNHQIEVPEDYGRQLVKQGWSEIKSRPTKTDDAPAETPADDKGDE